MEAVAHRLGLTSPLPGRVRWAVYLAAVVIFTGIVFLRGGASWVDAKALTLPTTELVQGQFHHAAEWNALPQPLGYPLLVAPIAETLPVVSGGSWCTDDPQIPDYKIVRMVWPPCSGPNPYHVAARPPWFRSQGALGILAWIVLAAGVVQLLRAAGVGRGPGEAGVVLGLAVLPAASDGIVQAFHPQDLFCVGLMALGLGLVLRRRWVAAGLVFGLAFSCKQFALLALVPALVAAPGWRERFKLGLPALLALGAVELPFYVLEPQATVRSLTAVPPFIGAGSLSGTVVGMTHMSETWKLIVARDGPVALAVVVAAAARWRLRDRLLDPVPILAVTAACLGGRLVFEVLNTSYYLLGVSVTLLTLEVASRRVPYRSVAWIVAMRVWISPLVMHAPSWTDAVLFLVGGLAAIALALSALTRRSSRAPAAVSVSPAPAPAVVAEPVLQPLFEPLFVTGPSP